MTKKDYELIAGAIRRSGFIKDKNRIRQAGREAMRRLIINDLIGTLSNDNPHFDDKQVKKRFEASG